MEKFNNFLRRAELDNLKDEDKTESHFKLIQVLSFNGFSFVAIVVSLVFGVINIGNGKPLIGWFEVGFGALAISNLILYWLTFKIKITSSIVLGGLMVILMSLLVDGGIDGTGVFWFYTFPVGAYLLTDQRLGTFWSVLFIGAIGVFGVLDRNGYLDVYYSPIQIRQLIVSLVALTVVVLIYEIAAQQNRLTVVKRTKDLLKSYHRLQKEIDGRREAQQRLAHLVDESNKRNKKLENLKRAITNLLEDLGGEKTKIEELSIRNEAVLKSIGDGVIATDEYGKIIRVNKNILRMLKTTERKLVGQGLLKALVAFDSQNQPIDNSERVEMDALVTGKVSKATYILQRFDGTVFTAALTAASLIVNGRPSGAVVTIRDITKEAEIDKAKSEFVSLASHQLRTPLTAINWYIEMLEDISKDSFSDEQKLYLKEAYSANQRMVALVNALLNVSRIDLGNFMVEPVPTDLVEVARTVLEELKNQIDAKQQVIVTDFNENLKKLNADPKLLYIIFQNLLSNAIKYTPQQGKITLAIKQLAKKISIEVVDSGYGIPKNQQDKVFTKLFRADNVLSRDTNGTGLGLYIVKAIVEEADGKISFVSKENKGSTFTVSLPRTGMKARKGNRGLAAY